MKFKSSLIFSTLFFVLSFLLCQNVFAQYKPTWESLDTRPVPQWWLNGKFGIFIHWGVYSVPGYANKGDYAEWYENGLRNGDSARIKYQKENFGDRHYYDLVNDFHAELFDPDEWAKLIEESGAKYVVLTSKHHDGFCLWPSKEADRDWGFPWNAVTAGPHKDLLGELFTAIRKTSVHPGLYYSLYEWYNPLWVSDRKKYVSDHMWPQMKELINVYKPDVLWTDGEWEAPASTWKSQEFLAWLYNDSPVKNTIVTYDRWGSGVRFKHGEVYTPEYQPDVDFEDHPWEESRGMGASYGYNRNEDAWDYNSAQSLVLQLIDKVSRGGNFLLDIGPDAHGKIPPIMQERLLQIGDWMHINSESIYNTVRWKTSSQWSEGNRNYKPAKRQDPVLKITVDPDPGYAVKEVFYTYNPTTNSLYAILPKYPSDKKIVLRNIQLPEASVVTFLSTKENFKWHNEGNDVVVSFPDYDPNKIKAPYAYVLKISNYGKYTHKPMMIVSYPNGSMTPEISFDKKFTGEIHYTTDGSEPTNNSNLYSGPFSINKTSDIKAIAIMPNALPSNVSTGEVKVYHWMKAEKLKNLKPGIVWKYYEPEGEISLESIQTSPVKKEGTTDVISQKVKQREEKYALQFDGYIKIDKDGVYHFSTISDDGSKLFIDNEEVVNNGGEHGTLEASGDAALKKGFHKIRVTYFDGGGVNDLKAFWQKGN
ncbi:MAG TPA: alpha-L-fucosidase, partial [Hanamia sp.]|nr:alpha-L-fucosidase [Hanamia sp.]